MGLQPVATTYRYPTLPCRVYALPPIYPVVMKREAKLLLFATE
ncbi:hypothetical protein HMPREF0650_0890 [Hoylesella buccalis ATCC 35310]|uniref:Uncharacterized protein n=1 Tax=Hoylesella buccalis ATCC 35310 TaxID=679190 RepID=D1W8R9_9BACT|nr:hypothetical protein HMPREF0650_0890 [Hoylesella buccalis ATCC 35310]